MIEININFLLYYIELEINTKLDPLKCKGKQIAVLKEDSRNGEISSCLLLCFIQCYCIKEWFPLNGNMRQEFHQTSTIHGKFVFPLEISKTLLIFELLLNYQPRIKHLYVKSFWMSDWTSFLPHNGIGNN